MVNSSSHPSRPPHLTAETYTARLSPVARTLPPGQNRVGSRIPLTLARPPDACHRRQPVTTWASFYIPAALASFPLLLFFSFPCSSSTGERCWRGRRSGDDDPGSDGKVRAGGRAGGDPGGGRGGAARDGAPHLAALPRRHRRAPVVPAACSGAAPAAGAGLPRYHGHDGVQVQEGDIHPEPHGPRAVPARPRGGAVAVPGGGFLRRPRARAVRPGAVARDAGLHQVGVRVQLQQGGVRVQRVRCELVVPVVGDDRRRERVERARRRRRRVVVPDAPAGGRPGGELREAAVRRWAEAQVPRARALGERRRRQVRRHRGPLPLLQAQEAPCEADDPRAGDQPEGGGHPRRRVLVAQVRAEADQGIAIPTRVLQVQHGARVPRPEARGARPRRPVDADRHLRGGAPPQPRRPGTAARAAAGAAQPLIFFRTPLSISTSSSPSLPPDQNHH